MNINSTQLGSFITATAAAVGAGFVAFGHSSLSEPASTAFIAVAGLFVALIHSKLLTANSPAPSSTTSKPAA